MGHGDGRVRPAFVNTPHSAIESMWFQYAMEDVPHAVAEATGDIPCRALDFHEYRSMEYGISFERAGTVTRHV